MPTFLLSSGPRSPPNFGLLRECRHSRGGWPKPTYGDVPIGALNDALPITFKVNLPSGWIAGFATAILPAQADVSAVRRPDVSNRY